MARSTWSGSISFGLVNIPVKLYGAVTPKKVAFNQINSATGNRVRQKKVDEATGDEVAFNEIVKGYDMGGGRYIILTDEDFEGIAPAKSKTINIEAFVKATEIDTLAYVKSYYLSPENVGAEKAYRMLVRSMRANQTVGIGRFVLRTVETLVALRPGDGDTLVASALVWADEINKPPNANDGTDPSDAEMAMADTLIQALTTEFAHADYKDTFRAEVLSLIERKAAGEEIVQPETSESTAPAPDLMAALTASLEAAKSAPRIEIDKKDEVTAS